MRRLLSVPPTHAIIAAIVAILIAMNPALTRPATADFDPSGAIAPWGFDHDGQVSDAPTDGGYIAIAAGNGHSLALKEDGTIKAWGPDGYGQLSDAPTDGGYTAIAAGKAFGLALKEDGTIDAWGADSDGQVSDAPTDGGHTAIAAGAYHSLAVKSDATPPVVTVPDDITTPATSPDGAVLDYTATATDDIDGELTASCEPASGHQFPIGTTTVTCEATDDSGNTANGSFTVTVQDATPPVVTVPDDITTPATSPDGAVLDYTATATDDIDGELTASCEPASGHQFPIGTTTVTCEATDDSGNTANGSFTVTVQDATPPVVTVPDDITTPATSPDGAVLDYTATATDDIDGELTASCEPASGHQFPIGTTTVTCEATDHSGNTANGSFTVTVLSAEEQLAELLDEVRALDLHKGISNSLERKLLGAAMNLERGHTVGACGKLGSFSNAVKAQAGKKIDLTDAAELVAAAENIEATIDC